MATIYRTMNISNQLAVFAEVVDGIIDLSGNCITVNLWIVRL